MAYAARNRQISYGTALNGDEAVVVHHGERHPLALHNLHVVHGFRLGRAMPGRVARLLAEEALPRTKLYLRLGAFSARVPLLEAVGT